MTLSRRFILSPLTILFIVCILLVGELASGTSLYFAFMAALAVFFACITYNILGGMSSISGIAYSRFALSTLFISQFGKMLLLERADSNLDVPQLTITVYAVYFGFLMLGTFVFWRLRLPLPKPVEPETPAQLKNLYAVALTGGMLGTIALMVLEFSQGNANTSLAHGFARALSYLLPFSLVLAVDSRIRSTHGQHSFGWMALWPTLAMMFEGFIYASRSPFLEPFAIIFLTCFLRNFKFQRRHLAAGFSIGAFFLLFVSPYFLYSRSLRGEATIREQALVMIRLLEEAPARWATIKTTVDEEALGTTGLVNYFETPGAATLNRFALIGPDSTLINACSTGFHYGFTSIKLDLLAEVPRFLFPNKPEIGSNKYLGHLDGQESDSFETTNSTITPISDSFGAFSWAGVVVFPFLVWPALFVVYESIFDMRRPWGTVATALLLFGLTEGSMGSSLTESMIKNPAYVLILSWGATWIIKMIPVVGDRTVLTRKMNAHPVSLGSQPSESAP